MTPSSGGGDLLVASWNIKYGIDVDGAIGELENQPAMRDVDVLLLQEMDEPGVAAIAAALGLSFVYRRGSVHRATGRDFGNAVLVRGEIGSVDTIGLPYQAAVRGEPRVAVRADTSIRGRQLVAVSVHTEIPALSLARRRSQFAAAAGSSRCRCPAIVGGDFNTASRRSIAAVDEAMGTAGLTRASEPDAATLRRAGRRFTLDHLYVRGVAVIERGIGDVSPASDHRPIWARVEMSRTGVACPEHPTTMTETDRTGHLQTGPGEGER